MEFRVRGMTCAHCEAAVARAVRALDPGADVTVDRGSGRVAIARTAADPEAIRQAIADEGYEVEAP